MTGSRNGGALTARTIDAQVPAAAVTRRAILDTAARMFRQDGYAATSLRDIAAACGIRAASLYHHFESKDQIVAEVLRIGVEQVFEDVRRAVIALPADATPRQLIGTAIHAHLEALHALQDYTSANVRIFGQVPAAVRAVHLPVRRAYERFWSGLIARCTGQRAAGAGHDPTLARSFLLAAMNGSLEWTRTRRTSIDAMAAELTALFVSGLCGPVVREPARECARRRIDPTSRARQRRTR